MYPYQPRNIWRSGNVKLDAFIITLVWHCVQLDFGTRSVADSTSDGTGNTDRDKCALVVTTHTKGVASKWVWWCFKLVLLIFYIYFIFTRFSFIVSRLSHKRGRTCLFLRACVSSTSSVKLQVYRCIVKGKHMQILSCTLNWTYCTDSLVYLKLHIIVLALPFCTWLIQRHL